MNDFIKEIASAMKESKTKPYDTVAKVLRVDEKRHMSTLTVEQMKPPHRWRLIVRQVTQ